MINTTIKHFFDNNFPVSETALSRMEQIIKPKSVSQNDIFIRHGKLNKSEYIILKGYCRSFLINPEGEDITLSFYKEQSVLSPHITRTKDQISILNFQALTDIELIEFDAGLFLNLMIENLEVRNFGNTILLNELIKKTEKEIALASLTAKERLIQFRSQYSILENLIPHPMIASYLGITNVSLSRLRSELMKS